MDTDTNNQHGFHIVIPARYGSSRFPGKVLAPIDGVPMVVRVHQRCLAAGAQSVMVATDDDRVREVCEQAGATVIMTRADHINGTDRIAEVAAQAQWGDEEIIVNVQGDEPLIPVTIVRQVGENLSKFSDATIATLATPIVTAEEFADTSAVKVVFDHRGLALYFSRSPIPFDRNSQVSDARPGTCSSVESGAGVSDKLLGYRHIGMYAYNVGFLRRYNDMQPCVIENLEMLEQLRALYHGERIHVAVANETPGIGVDTPDQLVAVERMIQAGEVS